jgi:hypothetical protein
MMGSKQKGLEALEGTQTRPTKVVHGNAGSPTLGFDEWKIVHLGVSTVVRDLTIQVVNVARNA